MDCYIVQNMMRTGFVNGKLPEETTCEHCGGDTIDYYKFDGMVFCGVDCIGGYIVECGHAEHVCA